MKIFAGGVENEKEIGMACDIDFARRIYNFYFSFLASRSTKTDKNFFKYKK